MRYVQCVKKKFAYRSMALVVFAAFSLLASALASGAVETAVAKIVDYHMPISVQGMKRASNAICADLYKSDTVVIAQAGSATIMFEDGSIRKFVGPAMIVMSSEIKSTDGVLGKLTSGLAGLFFSSGKESERARLAVRGTSTLETPSLTVPLLTYPPQGTFLIAAPDHLEWLPIDNATLYKIFLYDKNHLIWQEQTQNTSVHLPADSLHFRAAETYFWIIQVDIGNASLRSEQSSFGMIDTLSQLQIEEALRDISNSDLELRLAALLRINLYQSRDLLVEEGQEIDGLLKKYPHDYLALLAKAQLSEEMNLYREAAAFYREALTQ